jgi:predicted choloylglycine hydrolase
MKRRTFVKLSLLAPLFLKTACTQKGGRIHRFLNEDSRRFEMLEVSGSYYEIGYSAGKTFSKNIQHIVKNRQDWINALQKVVNSTSGRKFSDALLDNSRKHFPFIVDEIEGLADGCGYSFDLMWMMSIQSELNAYQKENPGCSTVYYKDSKHNWLAHNEDGDTSYSGKMYVLKAHPPSGVSYITLAYPGIIEGVGPSFNSFGMIETTNFIGCNKPEVGVPRYLLGRAILESKTMEEALQIATFQPRAFPWHHNLGSCQTKEYVSIETLPDGTVDIRRPNGVYIHTNHAIGEKTKDYKHQDLDYAKSSSITRYDVLTKEKNNAKLPIASSRVLLNWLSSREGKPYSPCRVPEGDITGETLGTALFDINNATMRLYKGYPAKAVPNGQFTDFRF